MKAEGGKATCSAVLLFLVTTLKGMRAGNPTKPSRMRPSDRSLSSSLDSNEIDLFPREDLEPLP